MTDPSEIQTWILNKLKQVDSRLDSIEANSHNVASSDQPLARPEILSKLETLIDDVKGLPHERGFPVDYRIGWRACCDEILQHLNDLDQGPVAQKPATSDTQLDPDGEEHY